MMLQIQTIKETDIHANATFKSSKYLQILEPLPNPSPYKSVVCCIPSWRSAKGTAMACFTLSTTSLSEGGSVASIVATKMASRRWNGNLPRRQPLCSKRRPKISWLASLPSNSKSHKKKIEDWNAEFLEVCQKRWWCCKRLWWWIEICWIRNEMSAHTALNNNNNNNNCIPIEVRFMINDINGDISKGDFQYFNIVEWMIFKFQATFSHLWKLGECPSRWKQDVSSWTHRLTSE